jgi:hypothetical protein
MAKQGEKIKQHYGLVKNVESQPKHLGIMTVPTHLYNTQTPNSWMYGSWKD